MEKLEVSEDKNYYFIKYGGVVFLQRKHLFKATDDSLYFWEELVNKLCKHILED